LRGYFFFQAEDGIRDRNVTGVQTCALPIWGLGSYDTKRLIEAAQQKAVRATLAMLEREATWARRGFKGAFLEGVALSSATFQHRSEERRVGEECRARRWTCR